MITKILILLILIGLLATGCASTSSSGSGSSKAAEVMPAGASPFKGTDVVQIGVVVGDVEKYAKSYASFFGVPVPEIIISETEDKAKTRYYGKPTFARVRQAFFYFDHITIEVLEPVGGPSTWKDFLDDHGEGVHHIAFEIKGMDAKIDEMDGRGIPLIQQGGWTGGRGGRYAYFESQKQLALILELLENL